MSDASGKAGTGQTPDLNAILAGSGGGGGSNSINIGIVTHRTSY